MILLNESDLACRGLGPSRKKFQNISLTAGSHCQSLPVTARVPVRMSCACDSPESRPETD